MSGSTGWTTLLAPEARVEIAEFPLPSPGPGEVLLRMSRANICGSDLHILHGRHPLMRPGHCMGHEGVGVVERLGSGVRHDSAGASLAEGDRVTFTYLVACGRCGACSADRENFCVHGFDHWCSPATDAPHFKGTFGSHYMLTAGQRLYALPPEVGDVAAAGANCALTQMGEAVARCQLGPGDTVLLLGAGGLGLCGAAVAAETGAQVVIADRIPGKARAALAFGAHEAIDLSAMDGAETDDALSRVANGAKADVVIDVTGAAPAFLTGLRATRTAGRFLSVGTVMPGGTVALDPAEFTRTGVTIEAVIRYRPRRLHETVRFLERNPGVPWKALVDKEFQGAEVSTALDEAAGGHATRVSLRLDGAA